MPTVSLTIGKLRGLGQCATRRGAFSVLALDHRDNLRQLLRPDAPDSVPAGELVAFKQQVVGALARAASAVLLDPEFGAAQCIASGALPGNVGLLVSAEATGYTGDPGARQSRVLPGWSIAKTRRMGASAAKLLVYYHPDSPTAPEIESLVREVAAECAAQDLPLFLEPLSYSLDPARKKLAPSEHRRVVIETARKLTPLGADVLKAEFPLDIASDPLESEWLKACSEISSLSRAPWILLSAAVDYDTYLRQVRVACQAGASGIAVGRAIWQEAIRLTGPARMAYLSDIAKPRLERLSHLCGEFARPWTDFYTPGEITPEWYKTY